MVYMIESQLASVMEALRSMTERGAETIAVRADTATRFNRDLDARMQGAVWTTGCASWYLTGPAATPCCGRTGPGAPAAASFDPADFGLTRHASGS